MKDRKFNKAVRIVFIFFIFLLSLPYLTTLSIDVIDIDSAQYAEIVREMVETGVYDNIQDNGRKYLDKPILTFWTILPFFEFFGANNFSYRLPAILITLLSCLSLYYTVLITSENKRRALFAVWIYLLLPGLYAMVVDPKIDVYLTAYLIFSHMFYYMGRIKNTNWFFAMYFSIGLGFITKGPISLVIPFISIGLDILFRRDWKLLTKMKILQGVFISLLFPGIWSYLLYQEFSSYGPSFFLWIQSFGRFYKDLYNVGYDPLYFYKNFAWSFLPFFLPLTFQSFYLCYRYWKGISFKEFIRKIKNGNYNNQDFVFGFWLYLFLFLISFSKFQLPQYVYWTLPAAAVIFSGILEKDFYSENLNKSTQFSYLISGFFYFAFLFVTPFFVLQDPFLSIWIPVLSLFVFLYSLKYLPFELSIIFSGGLGVLLMVSLYIYPILTSYQPSHKIGVIVQKLEPSKDTLYSYRIPSSKRSYAFYSDRLFRSIYDKKKFRAILEEESSRLVVIPREHLSQFQTFIGSDIQLEEIQYFKSYKVATPKVSFFLSSKRDQLAHEILLIQAKKIKGK